MGDAARCQSRIRNRKILYTGAASSALMLVLMTGSASAQSASDTDVRALQAQIDQLQRSINQLKAQQAQQAQQAQRQTQQVQTLQQLQQTQPQQTLVASAPYPSGSYPVKNPACVWQIKPGKTLTMCTPGGEVTLYGNMDVSLDGTSKNIGGTPNNVNITAPGGIVGPPQGNFGWMPAISTNSSYIGVRGFQKVSDYPFNFVYQLEAGFDLSAQPGDKQSSANLSDQVNGALFSRNSYIGIASAQWGALKIGKTDSPYKNSTAIFNPFAGQIGDYSSIMGNTGGDNRVEFGGRISHALWYESPTISGFQYNFLWAPGQNRSTTDDALAAGESDCTGGNDPTSAGSVGNGLQNTPSCTDGAWGNTISTNLSYTNGGFYMTAAYEWHEKVNRQSDITAIFGTAGTGLNGVVQPNFPGTSAGLTPFQQMLYSQDVGDETAWKIGALYNFTQTGTTIGAIFEDMHRYVNADLEFQDERTRNGTWVFLSQQLTNADSVHFGWAHAFKTPGDPGQHNDVTVLTPDGFAGVATNETRRTCTRRHTSASSATN